MLHHLLNYRSLFDTVKFFKELDFHNNSFVIGALLQPDYLNIRHLPNTMLQSVERELEDWISQKPGFLLENGLRNELQYIKEPVEKNIKYCLAEIAKMDQRRNISSRAVFTELYNLIKNEKLFYIPDPINYKENMSESNVNIVMLIDNRFYDNKLSELLKKNSESTGNIFDIISEEEIAELLELYKTNKS